jgi:hypothetical protein
MRQAFTELSGTKDNGEYQFYMIEVMYTFTYNEIQRYFCHNFCLLCFVTL